MCLLMKIEAKILPDGGLDLAEGFTGEEGGKILC